MRRRPETGKSSDGPGEEVDRWAKAVIGAAIEVHRVLGPGFLEGVYEEALCREMTMHQIPFARQRPFTIEYKGGKGGEGRVDILVADLLVVELKTVEEFAPIHVAQALSYLKAVGLRLALLINFNVPMLKEGIRRVVL